MLISQCSAHSELSSLGGYCFGVQTLRGEHLSRCIGRLAGKVRLELLGDLVRHVDLTLVSAQEHCALAL